MMADCKYCGNEIEWQETDDGWRAFEPESDERHRCQQFKSKKAPARQQRPFAVVTTTPDPLVVALRELTIELKELRQLLETQKLVV